MTPTQMRLITTRTVGSSRPCPPSDRIHATTEYPMRVYR